MKIYCAAGYFDNMQNVIGGSLRGVGINRLPAGVYLICCPTASTARNDPANKCKLPSYYLNVQCGWQEVKGYLTNERAAHGCPDRPVDCSRQTASMKLEKDVRRTGDWIFRYVFHSSQEFQLNLEGPLPRLLRHYVAFGLLHGVEPWQQLAVLLKKMQAKKLLQWDVTQDSSRVLVHWLQYLFLCKCMRHHVSCGQRQTFADILKVENICFFVEPFVLEIERNS